MSLNAIRKNKISRENSDNDHPDLTLSNVMEKPTGLQMVNDIQRENIAFHRIANTFVNMKGVPKLRAGSNNGRHSLFSSYS